MVQNELH